MTRTNGSAAPETTRIDLTLSPQDFARLAGYCPPGMDVPSLLTAIARGEIPLGPGENDQALLAEVEQQRNRALNEAASARAAVSVLSGQLARAKERIKALADPRTKRDASPDAGGPPPGGLAAKDHPPGSGEGESGKPASAGYASTG